MSNNHIPEMWLHKIEEAQRWTAVLFHDTAYPRIPYGQESCWEWPGTMREHIPQRCRDCGTSLGQLHIPTCCLEQCPVSHDQQHISCTEHYNLTLTQSAAAVTPHQ